MPYFMDSSGWYIVLVQFLGNHDQTFSIDERPGESIEKSSFSVSKKARKMQAICCRTLTCRNVLFLNSQKKVRARRINATELFKVRQSKQKVTELWLLPFMPLLQMIRHYDYDKRTLRTLVLHDDIKYGCDHEDAVSKMKNHQKRRRQVILVPRLVVKNTIECAPISDVTWRCLQKS